MAFQVRQESDGFRVVSQAKSGEFWDVDGPFATKDEADKSLSFHQAEWNSSHPELIEGE